MGTHASRDGIGDFAARFLASFFIAWTPFFSFSAFRGHPIPAVGLATSALLFALAALLIALAMGRDRGSRRVTIFTLLVLVFLDVQWPSLSPAVVTAVAVAIYGLFWSIREHLAPILATVFATVFVSTILIPRMDGTRGDSVVPNEDAEGPTSAPPGILIHVILDAFTGPAGIPEDLPGGASLQNEIRNRLQSQDFAIQPDAIAEYTASRSSISGILNFEAGPTPEDRFHGERPYVLDENVYFETLRRRGFEIHVHQSTYLDFCSGSPVDLASCFTYRLDDTDWLRGQALPDADKLAVLLGMYFNLPGFFEWAGKTHVRLHEGARRLGIPLPSPMEWDGAVAPIAAAASFDRFRDSVLAAPPGTAHFAHFLLPHGPYVYDENCRLRGSPFHWLGHHPIHGEGNTPEGRRDRYVRYFDQAKCALRMLQPLFDGLKAQGRWADAEIILHGDHGSRISEAVLRSKNRDTLTRQDLRDGFNTLFAVKLPGTKAREIDLGRTRPVSRLLAQIMGVPAEKDEKAPAPIVYLEGRDDEPWTALSWSSVR